MINGFFDRGELHLVRVHGIQARTLYQQGADVFAIPCRMNINSPWATPSLLDSDAGSFDDAVNFLYATVCNSSTGRRLNFYTYAANVPDCE